MTRARRVLVIGLAAVALLVGAAAAAALLIPRDRVAAAVAARAEALLGQPVRIQDIRLRFLPLPGVRLSGITVEGAGPAGTEDALASADAIEMRARLLPLLRGRVVVRSLTLEAPRLLVAIDSAGRTNLPVLRGEATLDGEAGAGAAPDGDGSAARREVAFAVQRLRVADGVLLFRDARDGADVVAEGWDQQLRIAGVVRGGRLERVELTGWLQVALLDATLPGVLLPVRDLGFRVTHDATLDRAGDRLDLRTVGLIAGGIALDGSGAVHSLSSPAARSAALALRGDGFEIARLADLLPDSLRSPLGLPGGRRADPFGTASLRIDLDGPLNADSFPPFDGLLIVADAGLRLGDAALADDVRAEVVFSADSAVLRSGGSLLGERFSAAIAVRGPGAPTAVLVFSGRADLARLASFGLVPDTLGLEGGVRADVQALVPIHDLPASRGAGTVQLSGLRLVGADPALVVPSGTLTLAGPRIRGEPLTVRIGEDGDLAVRAELDGWVPALLDPAAPIPRLVADVTADTLDLDRLLGPPAGAYSELLFARLQDRPLGDGRTAAEAAEALDMRLPAPLAVDAEVRFRADRIVRNVLAYEDLDITARVRPGGAELLTARFRFMGGTVRAAGALRPVSRDSAGSPDRARLTGTYALTGVGAAPLFNRLTPFRDHLAGDLSMAGSVAMDLDHQMLPERATLAGEGSIAISNGRLANWRVLGAVGARLGLPALDTVRFRAWAGAFRLTGPVVTLEDVALDGRDVSARAVGSFDFGGRLDVGATLFLSRELAARAGAVGEQVLAAAGTGDRLPVGLRIRGAAGAPDVAIDLSEARDSVLARARAAAEEQARRAAARAADAALDRLEVPDSLRGLPPDSLRRVLGDSLYELLPDSLRVPPDSLRALAEEALRARLRRLFGDG